MAPRLKKATAFVIGLLFLAGTQAQYLTPTAPVWQGGISQIDKGNGAFLSPDGKVLVVVSKDATVRSFNPITGSVGWTYSPSDPSTANSFGGAFFCNYEGQPYILISVTTNAIFSDLAKSTLVAIDPATGKELYSTPQIAGVTKGTPLCTEDGSIILATHNENAEKGHFSVFNYGASAVNYTYDAPSVGNSSYPFGAVGYYYSPVAGNYPQGASNPNDLFMWVSDTPGSATQGGNGQMFAFQIPVVQPFNATPLEAYKVGNATTYQSPNPPVFAGQGYIMYQACTKSELRYWQGDGLARNFFSAAAAQTIGFDRGLPRFAAPGAPPTLSSSPLTPNVYGPTAGAQIFMMPYDFSTNTVVSTSSPLTNKVLISPDDAYIYYATAEAGLFQLDATTLKVVWNITTGGAVTGELAQSLDGTYIYVPDSAGMLSAYQVKNKSTVESVFPSATPTTAAPTVLEMSEAPTPRSSSSTSMASSTSLPTAPPIEASKPTAPVSAPIPAPAPTPVASPVSAASPAPGTSFIGIVVVALLAYL